MRAAQTVDTRVDNMITLNDIIQYITIQDHNMVDTVLYKIIHYNARS
jgi:hypothetical protein